MPPQKEMENHHPDQSEHQDNASSSSNAMARAYNELLSSSSALNFRQTRLEILRALTSNDTGVPLTNRRHTTPVVPETQDPLSVPMMNNLLNNLRQQQQPQQNPILPGAASLQEPQSLSVPAMNSLLAKLDQPTASRRHSMPLGISGASVQDQTDPMSLFAKLQQQQHPSSPLPRQPPHRQSIGMSPIALEQKKTQENPQSITDMQSLLAHLRQQPMSRRHSNPLQAAGMAATTAVAAAQMPPEPMSIAEMKSLFSKLHQPQAPLTPPKTPTMNSLYAKLNEPTTLRNSFWYQDPRQQQQEQTVMASIPQDSRKRAASSSDDSDGTPKKKRSRRTRDEQWNIMYQRLVKYKEEHGNCLVHWQYKEDIQLGRWVSKQREYRHDLSADRREKLDRIGFVWVATGVSHQNQWDENFERLRRYKEEHGHCQVPWLYKEDRKLVGWVQNQRRRKHTLSPDRKARLDSIGFAWEGIRGKYTRVPGKHKRIKNTKKEEKKPAAAAPTSPPSSSSDDESTLGSPSSSVAKSTASFSAEEDQIILKAIVGTGNSPSTSNEPDLGYWEMLRGLAHNKSVEDLYQRATELSMARKSEAKQQRKDPPSAQQQEEPSASNLKSEEENRLGVESSSDDAAAAAALAAQQGVATIATAAAAPTASAEYASVLPPNTSTTATTRNTEETPVHVLMLAATAAAVAEASENSSESLSVSKHEEV